MSTFVQDLRYAIRILAKSPGFTLVVVLTLALGIGANTAIFSVVNAVLLNPLPYPHPDQLMTVASATESFGESSISYPDYQDWARENRTFASLAAYKSFLGFNLAGQGEAERVSAVEVTSNFFATLGVTPRLGRAFNAAEDQLDGPPAVILSAGFWNSKFGSAPDVIGKTVNLDGRDYTIVGVLPASYYFCCDTINYVPGDVFVPLGQDRNPWMKDRRIHPGIYGLGRLREGVTPAQARADMAGVAGRMEAAYPEADKDRGIAVTPLKQEIVSHIRPFLLVLLAAVGFVLLIACVNVANLLLARSTRRAREFAIRTALGATQGRVIRQLLTESVLLALGGGALGMALASWGTMAGLAILPSTLPRAADVRVDPRVLGFTAAISLAAGILFGLVPALKTFRPGLQATLSESGRGGSGARHRTQRVFVVAETALAVILLIGAGLTIRTLVGLWNVRPGFDPHNVLTFEMGFPPSVTNAGPDQIRANLAELTGKIAAIPGVTAVSVTNGAFPLYGESDLAFWVGGQAKPANDNEMHGAIWYVTGPGYIEAMKIPLLRGRFLTAADDAKSRPVCVIDENLARKFFPNENPVGKHLNFDLVYQQLEIVGVVGHVKQFGLDEGARSPILAQFYTPQAQIPDALTKAFSSSTGFVVRTQGPPEATTAAIREAVREYNSATVIFQTRTMDFYIARSLASRRFAMILLAAFAGLALLLASIGIYGVVSYIVGERTREIGIRIALGAQRRDVLRLVVGEGARMALAGVGVGLAGAFVLTRLMASVLFGVSAHDPVTFGVVAIVLAGIGLLACYVPARRATRVDPIVALRYE